MGLLLFATRKQLPEGDPMSASPAAPVKETKAQRAERLKQQKNP